MSPTGYIVSTCPRRICSIRIHMSAFIRDRQGQGRCQLDPNKIKFGRSRAAIARLDILPGSVPFPPLLRCVSQCLICYPQLWFVNGDFSVSRLLSKALVRNLHRREGTLFSSTEDIGYANQSDRDWLDAQGRMSTCSMKTTIIKCRAE